MTLEAGLEAAFRYTVTEADRAAALGGGEVPMLATPRVLALAEWATVAAAGALEDERDRGGHPDRVEPRCGPRVTCIPEGGVDPDVSRASERSRPRVNLSSNPGRCGSS
jgi:hypothetical protein